MGGKKITLGFIGCGNMAKSIINGILKNGLLTPRDIGYHDPHATDVPEGLTYFEDNISLVDGCRYIILAIKPNMINDILDEISKSSSGKVIGSIVAGITTEVMAKAMPKAHIIRIMPNTCAAIGQSYTCLSADNNLTEIEFNMFKDIFSSVGKVEIIKESYFDVCAAVCSCGVAFGHILIESMGDGGVLCGLSKEKSIEMAAYAILGASNMVISSDESPTELKDRICSPGGMTIKAMQALENGGFRASVISAIEAAYEKGKTIK